MYNLDILGYMSESELQVIEVWSSTVPKNGVIVEFGSQMGRSSYCWATSCDPSVKVYCLDLFLEKKKFHITNEVNEHFPNSQEYNVWEEFKKNTQGLNNIIPLRGHSPKQTGEIYPGNIINVFFMDGNHINPDDLNNFYFYQKYFDKHVLLCGHDYSEKFPDVIKNVKLFEEMYQTKATFYPNTTLWSIQL